VLRVAPRIALALALLLAPPSAALTLPDGAEALADVMRADGTMLLASGPFRDGAVPGETLSGALRQQSWRLPGKAASTSSLIAQMSAALAVDGATALYTCAARACGGFDFRFALDLLPEPQMHVDLADYRYAAISAPDGRAWVLVVSRSADDAFVQLSTLTPAGEVAPAIPPADVAALPPPPAVPADMQAFATALEGGGALVLQDVDFAVGAVDLADPEAPSLRLIAAYLAANPARAVAIVGHTDASGTLDANITLSRARARAVRAALVDLGAEGGRITAEGVGFLAPRATNLTEEGRQQNRRVEVMLTSTR
jgi:outer membrane protein OmpA-like peptidoglycan-associated protein